MTLKISGLEGYYTVRAVEYCYLVSWRVADQIPGSNGKDSRFVSYLCRKCTPGPLNTVFGAASRGLLQKHLLDVHGILADISYSTHGNTDEGLYRLIPPEDFVKGGSKKMYPDAILWRWVEAFEENRVPRVVGTPLAVHKVGSKEVDPQGDYSCARKFLARDCQQSEENSTGQVHWNEELWLSLINIVEKLEDENICKKWNRVPMLFPPRLVRKFSKVALGQRLIKNRFGGLAWEIKCDLKPQRYTKGVTEVVIKRMQRFCKNRKFRRENVQDKGVHCEKRVSFKKVPSIKACLNMDMELNKQLNSLVGMLDDQLLPATVKHGFESCLDISKHILSENHTTRKVLKLAIKVAYQKQQREVIVSKMKQYTHSLSQVVNMWKVAN